MMGRMGGRKGLLMMGKMGGQERSAHEEGEGGVGR